MKSVVGGLGFGSTEFIVIRPDREKLLLPLLLRYLSRSEFREAGARNMTGSAGQQRVPPDFVRTYEISLPPLDEQERIVAELEAAQLQIRNCELQIDECKKRMKQIIEKVWTEDGKQHEG